MFKAAATVVLHTARLGDMSKVAESGVTNYLRSSWNGGGSSHDFLIGNTLEVGQTEDLATATAIKGVESVAK